MKRKGAGAGANMQAKNIFEAKEPRARIREPLSN